LARLPYRGSVDPTPLKSAPDPALAAVAQRCLARRSDLFHAWIALVRESGRYRDSWVDEEELRAKALEVFELILCRIAGLEVSEDLSTVSERVGQRRAEQGVSLAEVQAAANLDFQIVWEAMLAEADDAEKAALLRHAPSIWAVVDHHTQRITAAYRFRLEEIERVSGDRRRDWFGRLLKCDGERPDVVRQASEALGLEVDGRFRVIIAARDHAARLRETRDTLAALRWSYHYQEVEVGDLLLVRSTAENDKRLMNALSGLRCAVAPPAYGLAEVPRATKIAADILMALRRDRQEPGLLEDTWFAVAAAQTPLVAQALAARIRKSLERVHDADVLIQTAQVFCDGDGTASRAATELFCHRNTVLNRLDKFRDLTGYDMRRPRDAATFLFAMSGEQE
jgi:hypothetical protein